MRTTYLALFFFVLFVSKANAQNLVTIECTIDQSQGSDIYALDLNKGSIQFLQIGGETKKSAAYLHKMRLTHSELEFIFLYPLPLEGPIKISRLDGLMYVSGTQKEKIGSCKPAETKKIDAPAIVFNESNVFSINCNWISSLNYDQDTYNKPPFTFIANISKMQIHLMKENSNEIEYSSKVIEYNKELSYIRFKHPNKYSAGSEVLINFFSGLTYTVPVGDDTPIRGSFHRCVTGKQIDRKY